MKSALLVIDVQKIYYEENSIYFVENSQTVVDRINELIKYFEKKNKMIVYIRHEHTEDKINTGRMFDFAGDEEDIEFKKGSVDVEFIDSLYISKKAFHIEKNRYNAFINTNLDELLKENCIDKVVICGFMTNFCCESTARHAHDIDYYVDFVVDAMGTPGTEMLNPEETANATIATIESGFGIIVKTEDVIKDGN